MTRFALTLVAAMIAVAGLLAVPKAGGQQQNPVLVAVGDISPDPFRPTLGGQDDNRTADLVGQLHPDRVVLLGDVQYEFGKLEAYRHSEGYFRSWGRPAIQTLTCPAAGNHEYWTSPGAAGFQAYFADRLRACASSGHPELGYYAYDLGTWRIYALSSDCRRTSPYTSPPCGQTSDQVRWLKADLQAHASRRCILAYWHHPRFGTYFGDDSLLDYIWRALNHVHADVVLNGHEHAYTRHTALTWDGHVASAAQGIREIIVGTGGRSLLPFNKPPREGTKVRDDQHYGVLKLTLRDGGWTSSFHRTDGTVTDSVSASCWA
jgi:hypothetical protein